MLPIQWEEIFKRGFYGVPSGLNDFEKEQYKDKITNLRNTEFLYPNEISIKYIEKIIFRSNADKKRAEALLGDSLTQFNISVNENKFMDYSELLQTKCNYLCDYKIYEKNFKLVVGLIFKAPNYELFEHEIKIIYKDEKIEFINVIDEDKCEHLEKPKNSPNCYYFEIHIGNANVKKVEYLMNGFVCAIWDNKNQIINF